MSPPRAAQRVEPEPPGVNRNGLQGHEGIGPRVGLVLDAGRTGILTSVIGHADTAMIGARC